MKARIVADVAKLPTYRFSYRSPMWWGTVSFVVIEGLGFIFGIAVYFYLQSQNPDWPFSQPPPLLWPTIFTVLLLASEVPNIWTRRAALAQDLAAVRRGILIMSAIGMLGLAVRLVELTTLTPRWDTNAFGSTIWFLIGLHTFHLITDVAETLVFAVVMFAGPIDSRRFTEIEDNQGYWDFVVIAWLPIYFTVYWAPRLLAGSSA